jgi:hypothetical protein
MCLTTTTVSHQQNDITPVHHSLQAPKNSSAKSVSFFTSMTVEAMLAEWSRLSDPVRSVLSLQKGERNISEEVTSEGDCRELAGNPSTGIRNNVPGNLAVKSTLRKYYSHSPLLFFRQPFHPNSDLAHAALAYPCNIRLAAQEAARRQLLPDMLPGNSQIDRVGLSNNKTRQIMTELGNINIYECICGLRFSRRWLSICLLGCDAVRCAGYLPTLLPSKLRHRVPPKHRLISTTLNGVTFEKPALITYKVTDWATCLTV